MNEVEQTTLHLIFSAAMQEFLEKGFKSASLRNIVKMAHFMVTMTVRKIYLRHW